MPAAAIRRATTAIMMYFFMDASMKDGFSSSAYHPDNQCTTFFLRDCLEIRVIVRSDLGRILSIRLRQTAGVALATSRIWRLRGGERRPEDERTKKAPCHLVTR